MIHARLLPFVAVLALLFVPSACTRGNASTGNGNATQASPRVLVGAGATLPYPLYSKWASEYARIDPTVRVNYQSLGSGAGVRQVSDGVVDFGATDEPMSKEQLERSATKLVHVPTTVGAVAFAFNVPGRHELALTGELAAEIFLGKVTRWDDERLRALNPGAPLPSEAIIVVHRADGSGTSAALTSYLSRHDEAWKTSVGSGTSPRFPVGVGAKGNEGVTALVRSTPMSIGYVELSYAHQSNLATAKVKNPAGRLVAPTLDAVERAAKSVSAAAASADAPVVLLDAPDEGAYPIAAVSFVVVPADAHGRPNAEALAKFLWWAVHDGQSFAQELDYVPLPAPLVTRAEHELRALRSDGHPLLAPPLGTDR